MDGREVSRRLLVEVHRHAHELVEKHRCRPALTALLVGGDPASRQYIRNKRRWAAQLGFASELIELDDETATTESLLELIDRLNRDAEVTGILIQLPLPERIDKFRLFDAIDPLKDVDGVNILSAGGFYRGGWGRFIPCTPRGVLTLLSAYRVPTDGMRAVVIGRSEIAGKPLALILGGRACNATVTWCHRHTRDLAAICQEADILAACTGAETGGSYLITPEMVKAGACVIDVGFRLVAPKRFAGDVDFEGVRKVAGWVTPNPGGTGPMTVLGLMQNMVDAARYQYGLERAHYSV